MGNIKTATGIAWEHFTGDTIQTLWRVLWLQKMPSARRQLSSRCSNYFASETDATEFAEQQASAGHEIISVMAFDLRTTQE